MNQNVLIVARTRMSGDRVCIGGIVIDNDPSKHFLRSIRLHKSNGGHLTQDMQIKVGDVLNLEFSPAEQVRPPHTEDVLVRKGERQYSMSDTEISRFLREHADQFERQGRWATGSPDSIFGVSMKPTSSGSGYIGQASIPSVSTGFWVPDKDLEQQSDGKKTRYIYPNSNIGGIHRMTYKGLRDPTNMIRAGSLCRVSLARWWKPEDHPDDAPERCYLQLSQFYES